MNNKYKQEIIDLIGRLDKWVNMEKDNIRKSGKRQYYLSKIFAYTKVQRWLEARLRMLEREENKPTLADRLSARYNIDSIVQTGSEEKEKENERKMKNKIIEERNTKPEGEEIGR